MSKNTAPEIIHIVNRITLESIDKNTGSITESDYPTSEWFWNPEHPDCPQKYWKLSEGNIVEMSEEEKKEIDDDEIRQKKIQRLQEFFSLGIITEEEFNTAIMRI